MPLTSSAIPQALEAFKSFMRDRALEFLHFMDWLVDNGVIKNVSQKDGRKSGGVSVIAWSGGNRIMLSLLGNLAQFPSGLTGKLEHYIRTLIIYGASLFHTPTS